MFNGRASYKATAPAAPPMDLDAGKPQWRDVAMMGVVTLGFWGAAAVGGWIASLFGPHGYESAWEIGAPRLIGMAFGLLVGVAGFWLGFDFARLTRRSWIAYHRRIEDWHDTSIDTWNDQGGKVTEEATTEWEISVAHPEDVLWFILAMQDRVNAGDPAPWALRKITEEGVWYGTRKLAVNTNQARLLVSKLVEMGYITGREEGQAGRWVPDGEVAALTRFKARAKAL